MRLRELNEAVASYGVKPIGTDQRNWWNSLLQITPRGSGEWNSYEGWHVRVIVAHRLWSQITGQGNRPIQAVRQATYLLAALDDGWVAVTNQKVYQIQALGPALFNGGATLVKVPDWRH